MATQNRIYVSGKVRKDAVEITAVEVPIAAALVLEAVYGEGWVPTKIRQVEVDVGEDGPITAAQELERLQRAYGSESVAKAFGTDVSARQQINAMFKLDSAQAVKEAGIIPETEGNAIEVVQPQVGTKAYARQAAANAHPDDLKPVTAFDDPNADAALASAQADAQAKEDERREAEQKAADDRRAEVAAQAADLKASQADVNADNATKAEMQAELDARGVAYPSGATKADLQALLDANPAKSDDLS